MSGSGSPLGTYISGDSLFHRLDPRMEMLLLASYIAALFLSGTWTGLLICVVVLILAYGFARIPFSTMLRGCKVLAIIIIFMVLANSITFSATPPASFEQVPLFGSFGIKPQGFLLGLFMAVRIIAMVSAIFFLTYTTTVSALADAFSAMLSPLRKVRFPVDDASMMLSIALRFIPITADEFEQIRSAQRARGLVAESGSIMGRIRAWTSVLIPLFVGLFRRSDELSCAMESRCYTGKGRTHLKESKIELKQCSMSFAASFALVTLGVLL